MRTPFSFTSRPLQEHALSVLQADLFLKGCAPAVPTCTLTLPQWSPGYRIWPARAVRWTRKEEAGQCLHLAATRRRRRAQLHIIMCPSHLFLWHPAVLRCAVQTSAPDHPVPLIGPASPNSYSPRLYPPHSASPQDYVQHAIAREAKRVWALLQVRPPQMGALPAQSCLH